MWTLGGIGLGVFALLLVGIYFYGRSERKRIEGIQGFSRTCDFPDPTYLDDSDQEEPEEEDELCYSIFSPGTAYIDLQLDGVPSDDTNEEPIKKALARFEKAEGVTIQSLTFNIGTYGTLCAYPYINGVTITF